MQEKHWVKTLEFVPQGNKSQCPENNYSSLSEGFEYEMIYCIYDPQAFSAAFKRK